MRHVIPILVLTGIWLAAVLSGGEVAGMESIRTLLAPQEEWRWVTLSAASGLPAGRVVAMESDGDGFVWVGTDRGVAWFDGYQFLRPSIGDADSITGEIRRIVRKGNGDIVIHAGGALWTGRCGKLRRLPVNNAVAMVAPLDDNDLYVTTAKGHFRIHDDKWSQIAVQGGSRRLFPGAKGKPWLLTAESGLWHWNGQGWPEKPALTVGATFDVVTDEAGILAASVRLPSDMAGVWELPVNGASAAKRMGPDMARLTALAPNGEGVATFESGDVRIRVDGAWESLNNTFGAALLRRATSLFLRANGDVWAGTHGGINVFRAKSARLRAKAFAPGDGRNNIHEILRRRNGELWLATSNGVVVQDAKGEWRSLVEAGGMRLGVVTGLSEDDEGNVWVASGSTFGGALRLSGSTWRRFLKKDGLSDWPIHRIKRDRTGSLWFLTNAALGRGHPEEAGAIEWDGRQFRLLGSAHGMPDTTVMAFSQSPDGAYWFGTRGGILRFAGGQWERFLAPAGVVNPRIFDISIGPDGAVWFCHQLNGGGVGRLIRHADGAVETRYFTEIDGVPSDEVWAVYAEADGRVWAATANGVGVYRGGPWVAAGAGYGIEGIKTWALHFEDKELWFGSLGQGIFRLNRKERLDADPRLFFQPAVMTGDHWKASWRALAFHGAIRPSDILTRYRVDGGEWAPWSATREHSISSSSPGRHRIEVQSVGALGDVDTAPAVSTFFIPYPIYLRPEFLLTVAALLAAGGAVFFQAVRSRLRYTRELEIAKSRAEESGRARSAFLAVMSHEIRTPMNGVLGMTTVMLDTPLDQRQRSYMDTIRNSAEALLSVINDVLDFSKIESGTFQITPALFDLEEVCERVVTLLAARASEKSLLLAVDYPASVPNIVIGDGGRVRQILLNLAGNAIKFTDSGSVRISVAVAPPADGPMRLRIHVADTGIGIAAEKVPLLFQEFSQVDTSAARRHGGTGLGLAISKKLAEHMGGSISVESVPGNGSTFLCELPFELGPSPAPRLTYCGPCLILHPNAIIRETLAVFCRDLGLKVEALPGIVPFPAEPFPIVLVAERWHDDIAGRAGLAGAVILRIDERESSSTLSLIPLSRRRLRAALAETGDSQSPAAPRLPDTEFGGRVLVVEDNLTNQRVIRLLLEKLGCTVVVAGDGAQAVRLSQQQPFDLVFMDVQMPVMDGLEATQRIRELPAPNSLTPILALTANAMEEDRQRCLDAGMSGYLAKPVVRDELIAALRQYLRAAKPNSVH